MIYSLDIAFVQDGRSVLMKAVMTSRVVIVELLLKAGAEINVKCVVCLFV